MTGPIAHSDVASTPAARIESVAFVSLGCPKNLVDSEKMLGTLAASGYRLVSDHDEADAIVVNTCGFLEHSSLPNSRRRPSYGQV